MPALVGRIVDIAEDKRHLSLERGFMVIAAAGEQGPELGRLPLDDLAAVILTGRGITHSSNLLAALAQAGIPLVICGSNLSPVGVLWSSEGHHAQAGRMDAQLAATRPLNKRLWQQVVKAKLQMQAAALSALGKPAASVAALVKRVRSGDPDNLEAQAAQHYWKLLFGPAFRRDREAPGLNALLNYGYAVLRAACARAIMGAGLHPSLGIHHANAQNAFRLADDLMEPFRPLIDLRVHALAMQGHLVVDRRTKPLLAQVMYLDLPGPAGRSPTMAAIVRLATALAQTYLGERSELELPYSTAADLLAFAQLDAQQATDAA